MIEAFSSLYKELIEQDPIEVSVSQELEIWNDADGELENVVNDFFSEFIHAYGLFHELLEKSDAIGDNHELRLSIVDGDILMEGVTHISGQWEETDENEPKEKHFKWIFDHKGNVKSVQ